MEKIIQEFIETQDIYSKKFRTLFRKVFPYTEKMGKPLHQFNAIEFIDLFAAMGWTRDTTFRSAKWAIFQYFDWLEDRGIQTTKYLLLHLQANDIDPDKRVERYFESFQAIDLAFEKAFPKIDNLRFKSREMCCLLLSMIGLSNAQIASLKTDEIHLEEQSIVIGEHSFHDIPHPIIQKIYDAAHAPGYATRNQKYYFSDLPYAIKSTMNSKPIDASYVKLLLGKSAQITKPVCTQSMLPHDLRESYLFCQMYAYEHTNNMVINQRISHDYSYSTLFKEVLSRWNSVGIPKKNATLFFTNYDGWKWFVRKKRSE